MGSIGKRHFRLLKEAGEEVVGFDNKDGTTLMGFNYNNVDMIWICTPTKYHFEYAMEFIKRGKKVFIEKPITSNMEDAETIREMGGQVWVACNYRFHPAVVALKDNLHLVGNILYCNMHHSHYLPYQRENWQEYIKDTNILLDVGIHFVDLALWLFGLATTSNIDYDFVTNQDYNDHARILLFHGDSKTYIDLDYLRRDKSWGIEVIGTERTLTLLNGKCRFNDKDSVLQLSYNGAEIDNMYKKQLYYLLKNDWQSNVSEHLEALKVCV
jgi:predicted dehydrogenase